MDWSDELLSLIQVFFGTGSTSMMNPCLRLPVLQDYMSVGMNFSSRAVATEMNTILSGLEFLVLIPDSTLLA